jgi:Putative papain-like cysteine peptidase (DUF1796)
MVVKRFLCIVVVIVISLLWYDSVAMNELKEIGSLDETYRESEIPTVISLGWDCEVAVRLRQNNVRKEAFPFDWLQTELFIAIHQLIGNKFFNFLEKSYLTKDTSGLNVRNTYYGINFGHDFPNNTNVNFDPNADGSSEGIIASKFLSFLEPIKQKYQRRIERLYKVLKESESVIFIRTGNITPKEAKNFKNMVQKMYPKLKVLLVCIHRQHNLKAQWKIEGVKSFYATTTREESIYPHSWMSNNEWLEILRDLRIINK